jgi:hypothetical protein
MIGQWEKLFTPLLAYVATKAPGMIRELPVTHLRPKDCSSIVMPFRSLHPRMPVIRPYLIEELTWGVRRFALTP